MCVEHETLANTKLFFWLYDICHAPLTRCPLAWQRIWAFLQTKNTKRNLLVCSVCASSHYEELTDENNLVSSCVTYWPSVDASPSSAKVYLSIPTVRIQRNIYAQLVNVLGVWVSTNVLYTKGYEHTRTRNWSESGLGNLRGAPLNRSRCLGGESTPRPYGRLTRRPAPHVHHEALANKKTFVCGCVRWSFRWRLTLKRECVF